jgi:hypothetical protein
MFLMFGLLLVATGIQLFRHRDEDPSVEDNPVVSAVSRWLPVGDRYDGGRLVTRENGRRVLTPLALVLVAIGTTDVLFALDSIPAIFGITQEAYIVFGANAFARDSRSFRPIDESVPSSASCSCVSVSTGCSTRRTPRCPVNVAPFSSGARGVRGKATTPHVAARWTMEARAKR